MTDPRILSAILRQNFLMFVLKVFQTLHPNTPYSKNWHVEAICFAIEQVINGTDNRLLITVPPRHLKSICASIALPAWLLGINPAMKMIVASYGAELSDKHSQHFRTIVEAQWYKDLFPHMARKPIRNSSTEYVTYCNGMRRSVSVGGAVTGMGADILIIDDLMKAQDASSEVERQKAKDFFDQTLLSRLDDKQNGAIVAILQRLHEDDVPGYLLEKGGYTHLNLPSIADQTEEIALYGGRTYSRLAGEVLFESREPKETLGQLRIDMGSYAFSAQYLQNPTPIDGARIDWSKVATYSEQHDPNYYQEVVQSWDTGMTEEATSDFSVCVTWGFREGLWFLLDVYRARLNFGDLKDKVVAMSRFYNARYVIVEWAASGIPLVTELRSDGNTHIIRNRPRLSKEVRFEAQMASFMSGKYLIPEEASYLREFKRELSAFPNSKYDDQVDALSQFLEWSKFPRTRVVLDVDQKTGRRRRRKTTRRQRN